MNNDWKEYNNSVQRLTQQEIETLHVKAASGSLFYFSQECLEIDKITKHHHGGICDILEKDFAYTRMGVTGHKKSMILIPRGCFKSTLSTVAFAAWTIGKWHQVRILFDSRVVTNSEAFCKEVGIRMSTPKYQSVFPCSFKYGKEGLRLADMLKKEDNIEVAGVGAEKTSRHYEIIIADDLVGEENVTTAEQIEKVKRHYSTLFSLLEPWGMLVLVGTHWHHADLYAHILSTDPEYKVYRRSCYEVDENFRPIKDENGKEKLWIHTAGDGKPHLTEKVLESLKKTQGSYLFSCLYGMNPVSGDACLFKDIFKTLINKEQIQPGRKILTIDAAYSQNKLSDSTAFVLGNHVNNQKIQILKMIKGRYSATDILGIMFSVAIEFPDVEIAVESIAYEWLKNMVMNEQNKRKIYFPFGQLKHKSKAKLERIKRLQPLWESNGIELVYPQIIFDENGFTQDMIEYLMKELSGIIVSAILSEHDDLIDALAYQYDFFIQDSESVVKEETFTSEEVKKRRDEFIIKQLLDLTEKKEKFYNVWEEII